MANQKRKSKKAVGQIEGHTSGAGRRVSLFLGAVLGLIGAVGAYQLQAAISGPYSQLAIAAPAVVITGMFLPHFAGSAWKTKQYFLWVGLVGAFGLCICVAFFGTAERLFIAGASAHAEREAGRSAASRAQADLEKAKADFQTARVAADKVRGLEGKGCNAKCLSIKASETAARNRVKELEGALKTTQGGAVEEADLKAPEWLLPAALDFASIFLVSFGLGGHRTQTEEKKKVKRRRTKKVKTPPPAQTGNVVTLHKKAA